MFIVMADEKGLKIGGNRTIHLVELLAENL